MLSAAARGLRERLPLAPQHQGECPAHDLGYRHYWELCVLLALRDGLRCGDVFVPGSRRYADPASYLLTPAQWEPKRAEFCALVER